MKVLHFISSLKHGGAEKLVVDLLPLMKFQGIEVCLVSMTDELALASFLEKQGIPVYTLKYQGNIYRIDQVLKSIKKMKVILKKEKPEILHSHLYMPDVISRLAASRRYRLLTTLHSIDSWWSEKHRFRSVLKTWLDVYLGRTRKTHYIAVSESVKKVACQILHIPEKIIRTIYNGINLQNFRLKGNFEASNSPIIIQVGRFYKQKGHITSLRALQIVKRDYPNAKLLLVGDGPLRSSMEDEVKRLGLGKSVDFLGIRDDVPILLQQADVYWMPSEYEGLGIAAIEAMSCGLPIIATSVGGLREIVLDGETGYLIAKRSFEQLAKKTLKIFSNSNLAARMGLAGHQRVEQYFSIEKTVTDYMKAYKDLIEEKW